MSSKYSGCYVEHCEDENFATGLCIKHYTRKRRYGSTETTHAASSMDDKIRIHTRRGANGCLEWPTSLNNQGYPTVYWEDKVWLAHRAVWTHLRGPIEQGKFLDHRCHNPLCVNDGHLRETTSKQNGEHRQGPPRNNSSGFQGVAWYKDGGKWLAYCGHNGRKIHGGYYPPYELHVAAYKARLLRNEHFTHNDRDRFAFNARYPVRRPTSTCAS